MKLKEEAIDYRDGDAELSGLLIWNGNELARPGALVVHGGGGLDDHAKGRARQLAELGLLVFACDMYGKAVIGDRVTHDVGPQGPGVAYHPVSDKRSFQAIKAFLGEIVSTESCARS
jgi:dienelactone hydrolase